MYSTLPMTTPTAAHIGVAYVTFHMSACHWPVRTYDDDVYLYKKLQREDVTKSVLYTCIYIDIYVSIYMYVCIYIYKFAYINMYVYTYIYIYIYVCI
jgi:hypothetical protein